MALEENDVMSKMFKTLASRPVLLPEQLSFASLKRFLVSWEAWVTKFPGAKMRESLAPGTWRVLKLLSSFQEVKTDKVSSNVLGALLFQVYGPKTKMATLDYLRDLSMSPKLRTAVKVDMVAVMELISEWQFVYRWILPDRRPSRKEAFKVFCESVGPPGQVEELKASVAESKDVPRLETVMGGFVMLCEEAVAAQEKEQSLIRAQDRKRKAEQGGMDDGSVKKALISLIGSGDKQLLKSLSSVVTSGGGEFPTSTVSKRQKKKDRKLRQLNQAVKSGLPSSSSAVSTKILKCYGCGEDGHTRDKCPNRSRPDFVTRDNGRHTSLSK